VRVSTPLGGPSRAIELNPGRAILKSARRGPTVKCGFHSAARPCCARDDLTSRPVLEGSPIAALGIAGPQVEMIALIFLIFASLTLEVFAPGVGISAVSVLAVVMTVWWKPRAAVVFLVVFFGLQELLTNCAAEVDPLFAGTLGLLDEVALLAAGLRAVRVLSVGDRSWFAREDWTFAILFLVCGIISSVVHGGGGIAPAALGFALSCKFFGFILFAASVPWKEGDADRAVTAVIWAMPVLLLVGFIGYLFPDEVLKYLAPGQADASFTRGDVSFFMAPFPHPGVYGWAMAVGALAAITRLMRGHSPGPVIGLAAGVVGVILSVRRRPLVALPVSLFAVLLRVTGRQRLRVMGTFLVVAGLLVWLGGDFIHATVEDTMTSYLADDAAESARGLLVLGAVDLGKQDFPLGAGFGRFGTYASVLFYSDIYDQLALSHIYGLAPDSPYYIMDTYWPHILAEAGAVGLLALAVFMWRLWRRVRLLDSTEGRMAALLLVEGLVESLAGPVFDTSLQSLVIAIPIGMALRSIHAARRVDERRG